RDRSLHVVLWLGQLVLAAVFAFSGYEKLTRPIAALAAHMPWAIDVPPMLLAFIGGREGAGAIGLVLPALTPGQPRLTPLAAGRGRPRDAHEPRVDFSLRPGRVRQSARDSPPCTCLGVHRLGPPDARLNPREPERLNALAAIRARDVLSTRWSATPWRASGA